ncbi:outer membrane beta-barrel protein [Marinomonas ostreistagni]|uniref:outer membrane beta-barrel protein n=1 Tax=Marinomonas ostreistagni TaxID=359209 RepID=UPI00194F1906|nr:outer membrane beta-barrel protein [Marinomonas ostreistagni]MBM6551840.1 outer membrane beta-barrel protein [Marinomonas ostreistagni]
MKKLLLGAAVAAASTSALAAPIDNLVGGFGYLHYNEEFSGQDVTLHGVFGSLGYKHRVTQQFSLVPEVRVGLGIGDDTARYNSQDLDVELDEFIALSLKGQFDINQQLYVFANPTFAHGGFTIRGDNGSVSDSDHELGLGFGAGFKVAPNADLELAYENLEGTDLIGASLKIGFY